MNNLTNLESSIDPDKSKNIIKLALDLTQKNAIDILFKYLKDNQIYPELLINNVGISHYGNFVGCKTSEFQSIIDLNIVSFTNLTHKYLNYMNGHKAAILNVASTYAFRSAENQAVYAASKSYIYSFSRSLRKELAKSGIRISVFCPGKINTNFDEHSGKAAIINSNRKGISAEFAAKYAIDAMNDGKFMIIPGILRRTLRFLYQIFPTTF